MKIKVDVCKMMVFFVLFFSFCVNAVFSNSLVRVAQDLGSGTISLFFIKKPIINFIPIRHKDNETVFLEKVFIFPKAEIKDLQIEDFKGENYEIKIEQIKTPIEGIKLSIAYNTKKVSFDYKFTESVNSYHAIVFSFYNEELMEKLRKNVDSVLRTACLNFKS